MARRSAGSRGRASSEAVAAPDHCCRDINYVFELPTWEELDLFTVELTRVFRQENKALVEVLCKLRRGEVDPDTLELLRSRVIPIDPEAVIKPTLLYPKRNVRTKPDAPLTAAGRGDRERARVCEAQDAYPPLLQRRRLARRRRCAYYAPQSRPDAAPDVRMAKFLEPVQAVPDLALREGAQVMLVRRQSLSRADPGADLERRRVCSAFARSLIAQTSRKASSTGRAVRNGPLTSLTSVRRHPRLGAGVVARGPDARTNSRSSDEPRRGAHRRDPSVDGAAEGEVPAQGLVRRRRRDCRPAQRPS